MQSLLLVSLSVLDAAAATEIYPLSLHDALPICSAAKRSDDSGCDRATRALRCRTYAANSSTSQMIRLFGQRRARVARSDRKSTRLNSSHRCISYAVFCLKKKNRTKALANKRKDQ